MSDIVDIGSSKLDPDTNVLLVQAKAAQMGDDEDDAPGYDDTPVYGQLGLQARPYHKTNEGNAQAIVDTSLPGTSGVITAMRDARAASAKVVEELGEGETALHATGPGFDSRVFCKEQMVAVMVGDDVAIVADRENKVVSVTAFGHHFELSDRNGISMVADGAGIQIKGGTVCITGQVVLGGRTPTLPVLAGASGPAGVAALGVFIGAAGVLLYLAGAGSERRDRERDVVALEAAARPEVTFAKEETQRAHLAERRRDVGDLVLGGSVRNALVGRCSSEPAEVDAGRGNLSEEQGPGGLVGGGALCSERDGLRQCGL